MGKSSIFRTLKFKFAKIKCLRTELAEVCKEWFNDLFSYPKFSMNKISGRTNIGDFIFIGLFRNL